MILDCKHIGPLVVVALFSFSACKARNQTELFADLNEQDSRNFIRMTEVCDMAHIPLDAARNDPFIASYSDFFSNQNTWLDKDTYCKLWDASALVRKTPDDQYLARSFSYNLIIEKIDKPVYPTFPSLKANNAVKSDIGSQFMDDAANHRDAKSLAIARERMKAGDPVVGTWLNQRIAERNQLIDFNGFGRRCETAPNTFTLPYELYQEHQPFAVRNLIVLAKMGYLDGQMLQVWSGGSFGLGTLAFAPIPQVTETTFFPQAPFVLEPDYNFTSPGSNIDYSGAGVPLGEQSILKREDAIAKTKTDSIPASLYVGVDNPTMTQSGRRILPLSIGLGDLKQNANFAGSNVAPTTPIAVGRPQPFVTNNANSFLREALKADKTKGPFYRVRCVEIEEFPEKPWPTRSH